MYTQGAGFVIFFVIFILIIWILMYWREISTQYRWESIAIIVAIALLLAAYEQSSQREFRYSFTEVENGQSIDPRDPTSDKSVRKVNLTPVKETESISFTPPASLRGKGGNFYFKSGDSGNAVSGGERGILEFSLIDEGHSG